MWAFRTIWLTVFIILGCGPVDYNPPLKGHTFSESLFLRLKMDLWDVCWSKWNCVGCGKALSVPKEANKEEENTSKQEKTYIFNVAVIKIKKKHSTPGNVTVNMITQHNPQSWQYIYIKLWPNRVCRRKKRLSSVYIFVLFCFVVLTACTSIFATLPCWSTSTAAVLGC